MTAAAAKASMHACTNKTRRVDSDNTHKSTIELHTHENDYQILRIS